MMKTIGCLMAMLVLLSGCATVERYGITENMAKMGLKLAMEKEGLGGVVSDAQIDEVFAIIMAQERLKAIGADVETNAVLQAKIEAAFHKYDLAALSGLVKPTYMPPAGALYAGFLMDDAKIRVMNKLSINANAEDYTALLKAQREFGFNQICYFLLNEGDGGPVPTTFYRDKWFGDVDMDRVAMMRARIQAAKAMGFAVELWGFPDDSPSLRAATPEQIKGAYEAMVQHFGDLADSWCVGLEIDEWGETWWNKLWHKPDMTTIQGVVEILKATGKPVAVHLTDYKDINLALQSGADTFNAQFGWLSKPAQMTEAMAWLNQRKGTMKIVACEFNRDSVTPLATSLARAAMAAGAAGTQTGRP